MKFALVMVTGIVWGLLAGMVDERRRWRAAQSTFRASHRRVRIDYSSPFSSRAMTAWLPNDEYRRMADGRR